MENSNNSRNENTAGALTAPMRKKSGKKGMPTWMGTAIIVAVLVLLVLFVTFVMLNSRGVFKRMRVIAETENFKITVPMMSYMVYTEYQNLVSMYDQFSSQYGGGTQLQIPAADKTGTALDKTKPLRDQIYQVKTLDDGSQQTITWFDHFAELAVNDIRQVLACCEYARRDEIELSREEKDAIKLTLDNMALYAEQYGYTASAYISAMYGQGVTKKDVRKMLELTELANKYNKTVSESFVSGVGDEQVEEEYNKNKKDYDTYIDYIGYTFTATFSPATSSDNADTLNAQREEKYNTLKAAYKEAAERLEDCTVENFETVLKEELTRVFQLQDELEKGKELTTEEKTAAELRAVEAVGGARVENYNTSDAALLTEIDSWFKNEGGEEERKAGDVKKVVKEYDTCNNALNASGQPTALNPSTTPSSATSTYAVYITTSALHRDAGRVRSVAHILFKTDTYKDIEDITTLSAPLQVLAERLLNSDLEINAENMAKEMIKMMEKDISEKTTEDGRSYLAMEESAFISYGQTYTEDSSVTYDNVTEGQMVAEFEDWMFDSSRVVGEITDTPIKTSYGYHVMLYRGDEKPAWSHSIRVKLAEGKYEELLEQAKAEFELTVSDNEKLWNMITG